MDRVAEYLRIQEGYAAALGGLRWAADGEAVELADGSTFAFAGEVVSFVEGFALQRPLVHFAFVLHLLHLLRRDRPGTVPLARAFRAAGRVHRNAGVLCAVLSREVPSPPEPPSAWHVWRRVILQSITPLGFAAPSGQPPGGVDEVPPLTPEVFEAQLLRAAAGYSYEELVHWFKHGQGPVKEAGAAVARAVETRPPSLRGVLADLERRRRLAGAVPFVEQLVSALTLPPRQLAQHELPMGGYSDVATRGHPEQILPSQFALDDLEFVRRHCERELLYFRREEPHHRSREDLVVVLDQGVRTWGRVRLVLAGAVFAFARLAERARRPFLLAATSGQGTPCDPLRADRARLAELLEASDLTPHPGLALENVLEDQDGPARDVVLLTHPRSLAEPDVAAAARRVRPGTRLFAVSVDGHGEVGLSQVLHGSPVSLSRFRVGRDKSAPTPEPARASPVSVWSGDVEPVPFPFRFGPGSSSLAFDFDHAGEWVLAATADGMLYATRTDGSGAEVLPRPVAEGRVFVGVREVLGVAGGFVVAGLGQPGLVAAHYDLPTRTCRTHRFTPDPPTRPWSVNRVAWWYLRRPHTLVVQQRSGLQYLNLATCYRGTLQEGYVPGFPALDAPRGAGEVLLPLQGHGQHADPRAAWYWPRLTLDAHQGTLTLHHVAPAWASFTPRDDGKPLLQGCTLVAASCQGTTLAVVTRRPDRRYVLDLFRGPDGVPLAQLGVYRDSCQVALSADGRLVARRVTSSQVEIRDTHPGVPPVCRTPVGRFHHDAAVKLGRCWLTLAVSGTVHLVRWDQGRLVLAKLRGRDAQVGEVGVKAESNRCPDFLSPVSAGRFRASARNKLIAVVDAFGQVALFDPADRLVCMFFAFRQQIAAWMPDGTCYGPEALLGRPATPGALEAIGRALRSAWDRADKP